MHIAVLNAALRTLETAYDYQMVCLAAGGATG